MKKDFNEMLSELLSRLDIRAEFEAMGVKVVGAPNAAGWINAHSPFKKDDHASCGINVGAGSYRGYFTAFNQPGMQGKPYSAISFLDIAKELLPGMCGDWKLALRHFATKTGVKLSGKKKGNQAPTFQMIESFMADLPQDAREYLNQKRGLTDESIKKYQIGFRKSDKRNTFPVYDFDETLLNIRYHNSKKKPKTLNQPGFGDARLWGVDRISKVPGGSIVCITEGEFDSMLLEQETGLTSVSPTNGTNAFSHAWVDHFKGKNVCLVWDCDKPGRKAVEKIILPAFHKAVMSGDVLSLKIVWLFNGDAPKDQKDFTDYITKAGGTGPELLQLIQAAPLHKFPSIPIEDVLPDPDIFFDGNSFLPLDLVDYITEHRDLFFDSFDFYTYSKKKGVWKKTQDMEIERLISKAMGRRVKKAYILDALKILQAEAYKNSSELEIDPYLINMQNGMFNLRTGALVPHNKKYMSKIQLQVNYDPEALCPRWMQYLKETFPDDLGKAETIQDFSGYCLYPEIFIEKCLFLFGTGGNGKSVYLNTLTRIMGDKGDQNTTSIEPQMLQERFIVGHLKDKLLNISTEIETRVPLASNLLKKIISGELVQADQKFNKNLLMFRPIAKHIFSMNETPIITDRSWGFERRLIVVKFNQRFDGKNEDKFLDKKLKEETSGVFNWMLIGLKRVMKTEQITETQMMVKDRKDFLRTINPITSFVDETMEFGDYQFIKKTEMYKEYSKWCEESGVRRLSKMRFYAQLLTDYSQIVEKRGEGNQPRMFHGIGIQLLDI